MPSGPPRFAVLIKSETLIAENRLQRQTRFQNAGREACFIADTSGRFQRCIGSVWIRGGIVDVF